MLELPLHSSDLEAVTSDLQSLYDSGYRSLAIVFAHSYTFPSHELQIGALARSLGFTHVSESSQLLPMIKLVPRGVSSTADAYLTPILRRYLDGFFSGFDEKLRDGRMGSPRVEFMGSDGGLLDLAHFSGLKSILSGPAGGVVGYALTSWDEQEKKPIIGFVPSEIFFLDPITLKMGYQDRRRWDIDRCVAICGPV
jgi:5-oxoprolinase (ATP-hydrolysing)